MGKQQKKPANLKETADEMAITFRNLVKGPLPKVVYLGLDEQKRSTVLVGYRGNELIRCMQVEAFIVEQGDTIRQRSTQANGVTTLIFCFTKK